MLMKLWIKFTKENYMKYISHLDLMRLFQRSFRRCNIPIKYSQGFNPQPKMTIASPLALGIESAVEFMEIELEERISEKEFINAMNKDLPEGIRIIDAKYLESKSSIATYIHWSYYQIQFTANNVSSLDKLEDYIAKLLERDELIIEKEKRKGNKTITKEENIRPLIGNIAVSKDKTKTVSENSYQVTINCLLKSGDRGNLKPLDFLKALSKYTGIHIDADTVQIKRLNMFSEMENRIKPLM